MWGQGGSPISLAERTSRRYLTLLFILLSIVLTLQLYAWAVKTTSQNLDASASTSQAEVAKIDTQIRDLDAKPPGQSGFSNQQMQEANDVSRESDDVLVAATTAEHTASTLRRALFFKPDEAAPAVTCEKNTKDAEQWWCKAEVATFQWNHTATDIAGIRSGTAIIEGILLSFVLPTLLGTLGSVAYVVRTISDQAKTLTFSSVSPQRHLIRVGLGTLMGAVASLFGLSQQIDLSPLALAFLAGYGVEAMFSIFDGLISSIQKLGK